MTQLGAIVRLLMLVACLVPFTSSRQAAESLAPLFPLASSSPVSEAPDGKEDDERETDGKERLAAQSKQRLPVRELIHTLPLACAAHLNLSSSVQSTPPIPVDPFRNGLGTPYRC